MATEPNEQISNMPAETALPRSNGELVFEAPWEGRAFGIAVAMNNDGKYEWREFVDELAGEIAAAEKAGAESTYYERWVTSLERLAIEKGLVTPEEMDARAAEYASGDRDEEGHIH
ncbi:MAG: nitrile hydratase accessory protein [Chloroflexi bacterium]|nr:nitrile hydratase accessory protein [Chloroflexota bacterium]